MNTLTEGRALAPLTWLFGVQRPFWRAVLHAYLIVATFAVLTPVLLFTVLHMKRTPTRVIAAVGTEWSLWDWLGTIVFAPALETVLIAISVALIGLLTKRPVLIAALAASVGAGLHGLFSLAWALAAYFAFFVFCFMYVEWEKVSGKRAFLAACLPHMLSNGTVMGLRWLVSQGAGS